MSANTQEGGTAQHPESNSPTAAKRQAYQSPAVDTIAAETLPAIAGTDACGTTPNAPNEGDCGN